MRWLELSQKYPLGGEVKLPKQPVYFNKPPGSLVAHNEALVRPIASVQLDYELELAVVIGRSGRHISESDALAHVAGYTILNDGSVRDWQRHGVAAGKNFYRSGSCGPWIVTSDLLPRSLGPVSYHSRKRRTKATFQRERDDFQRRRASGLYVADYAP